MFIMAETKEDVVRGAEVEKRRGSLASNRTGVFLQEGTGGRGAFVPITSQSMVKMKPLKYKLCKNKTIFLR